MTVQVIGQTAFEGGGGPVWLFVVACLVTTGRTQDYFDGQDLSTDSITDEDAHLLNSLVQVDETFPVIENEHTMRKKRLTMDFNGVQVSYPQYLRLVRLQEKVIKLGQIIAAIRKYRTPEELEKSPQYKRLVALHTSLEPLLPRKRPEGIHEAREPGMVSADESLELSLRGKRSPFSMDFKGMRVSYPQYLRLRALQEKVIKLDQLMWKMLRMYPMSELNKMPKWHTLVSLHTSLKKMLPDGYEDAGLEKLDLADLSKRASLDFNGFLVSYPQYMRLVDLQEKVIRLNKIVDKLSASRTDLDNNPKFQQLVQLRDSLKKLLPKNKSEKRGAYSMMFNGVQVRTGRYGRSKS